VVEKSGVGPSRWLCRCLALSLLFPQSFLVPFASNAGKMLAGSPNALNPTQHRFSTSSASSRDPQQLGKVGLAHDLATSPTPLPSPQSILLAINVHPCAPTIFLLLPLMMIIALAWTCQLSQNRDGFYRLRLALRGPSSSHWWRTQSHPQSILGTNVTLSNPRQFPSSLVDASPYTIDPSDSSNVRLHTPAPTHFSLSFFLVFQLWPGPLSQNQNHCHRRN
jgi:hypothetical protein